MNKQSVKYIAPGFLSGLLIFLCLSVFSAPVLGDEKKPRSREDLLFQEIPVVISAARKAQPLTEAPATMTVITADDIRYSGATTVPDLLRNVAGIEVISITARDQQVGIRGFNGPVNNKVLLIVDGRLVYDEFNSSIFWNMLPVGLTEIERIEVVKSPISSVYGAGAFSGVVNIITRSPEQLNGTTLHLTAGTGNTLIASFLHGGTTAGKRLQYKLSAEIDRVDEWEREPAESGGDIYRVNGVLNYLPGERTKLELSAGTTYTGNSNFLPDEFYGTIDLKSSIFYMMSRVQLNNFKISLSYKNKEDRHIWIQSGAILKPRTRSFDAELLHDIKLGNHSLLWGVNYHYRTFNKSELFSGGFNQHRWSAFIDGQLHISDKLRLTAGGRYDWHPQVGGHISPRFHLFYALHPGHNLRFSVSRAYINPVFSVFYLNLVMVDEYTIPPPFPPVPITFTVGILGNRDLEPEKTMSYELGIDSKWSDRFSLSLNLFFTQYNGFVRGTYSELFYEAGELFPGSPGGVLPKGFYSSFENGGDADGVGAELEARFKFNRWLSGYLNASFMRVTDRDDYIYTPEVNEEGNIRDDYPTLKVNAGLRLVLPRGFSLNLQANWVSSVHRELADESWRTYSVPVDDYLIVNGRLGFSFLKKKAEVALSVFNLFQNKHYQYPTLTAFPVPRSFQVGSRVRLTLIYKF